MWWVGCDLMISTFQHSTAELLLCGVVVTRDGHQTGMSSSRPAATASFLNLPSSCIDGILQLVEYLQHQHIMASAFLAKIKPVHLQNQIVKQDCAGQGTLLTASDLSCRERNPPLAHFVFAFE